MSNANLNSLVTSNLIEVKDAIKDCDYAVVINALEDVPNKGLQSRKLVVFFDHKEIQYDDVVAYSSRILQANNASIIKPNVFKIFDGWMKKTCVDIWATMFKPIFGFTPNSSIHIKEERRQA